MQPAQLPANEIERLSALTGLDVLDSGPEEEFDALIRVASLVCGVPISLISLVDVERQWFKANIGLPGVHETPRDVAFCAHAILQDGLFEVPDSTQDPRFFDNPLVTSAPDIRFYAGAPIVLSDGHRIGTLCVIDRTPRKLDPQQREILSSLAVAAAQALEGRKAIRAQQSTARELAKSKTMLSRTGELAAVGGWELDIPSGTIYWAEETCRIHGVAPGYQPDRTEAINFYAPEARPIIQAAVESAIATGRGWDLELPFVRNGGERIWVRTIGMAEYVDGVAVRLVGAFQDITQRHIEQMALQEAQERVRLATEGGGIGIWDLDLATGSLVWDEQIYRLYGFQPTVEQTAYSLWVNSVHEDDRERAEKTLEAAIATGQGLEMEFRVRWPDGSVHHLMCFGRVRTDAQGKAFRVVGTNWDVTAAAKHAQSLKDARDSAEQASLSKGQFLANMSHEIRTPMNAILGMLRLLQSTDLNSRQKDYADKTEGAAKSLLGLLNDILDYSKVEAGKMTLEREPFRLDQLLRSLSVVLSANVGNKDIEVLFDVDPSLPDVVLGDVMRLQQVLINLGGNAVKFTSQGQVVLALRRQSAITDSVCIEFAVQDSGIGIAPENQERIFSGFSQAEASTTRRFGGTGLGLAICKRLVELMGGAIQIASTPNVGSTFAFTLELPVVRDIPAELGGSNQTTLPPRKVLVVDDNAISGELTQRMVQSWGWEADLVRSGALALQTLQAEVLAPSNDCPYPVIYMDWQMPGLDGWETTRQLRQLSLAQGWKGPLIIMLTAHGRENLAQRSQQEQNMLNGFLVKPVTASMLFDAVLDAESGNNNLRRAAGGRSSQRRLHGMRVLVVEDNLINQQVADELLSAEGAIVSLSANGQQGVEAVAAAAPQFDVVLMDIQMPVLDGYGATKAIREQLQLQTLPIVAMTANAMASDRDACLAAGMNEHVGKPFDMGELVSLLLRVTGFAAPATAEPSRPTAVQGDPGVTAIDGLEFETAIGRMSGLTALYVRTAVEFQKTLSTVMLDLQAALEEGVPGKVTMLLHTLKGNAGTLGASALAQEAAALEKLSKTPGGLEQVGPACGGLALLTAKTHDLLGQAIRLLEPDTSGETHEAAPSLDSKPWINALQELRGLLEASDFSALQRYSELQSPLSGLPAEALEPLEAALQNVELEDALTACTALLAAYGGLTVH